MNLYQMRLSEQANVVLKRIATENAQLCVVWFNSEN